MVLGGAAILLPIAFVGAAAPAGDPVVVYNSDGQLWFPVDYRQWVFLSSGLGMTYGPMAAMGQMGPPMFNNVFVNPEGYRAFLKTGHWPDKTMFVLEVRTSESHASINKDGHFQTDIMGIEAEVKDSAAKTGEWTFYGFGMPKDRSTAASQAIPRTESCYSCHAANTAVENTFVQFYPDLYQVAQDKGTLNPKFRKLPITATKLLDLVETEGWSKGQPALEMAAAHSPDAAVLNAGTLNMVGYHLLQSKHASDAVGLFLWNAQKHPESANLQDSLAEAYVANGDKEGGRAATKRELELAASDASLSPEQRARLTSSGEKRLKQLSEVGHEK
jgi:hypothetical protein